MPTRVEIFEYDRSWPEHFERASRRIAALLGLDIGHIHHVGSTSILGLAAKPLIDIDVLMASAADIPAAADRLVPAGYEARGSRHGDGVLAFLRRGNPGERVYLCPPDSDTHEQRITFRDRLRSDPALAAGYEALKRALAAKFPLDGDAYTAAKGTFIKQALTAGQMTTTADPA
jgi:GrpB-like predicted nucleotidyltransferase (UPF0157 family)